MWIGRCASNGELWIVNGEWDSGQKLLPKLYLPVELFCETNSILSLLMN